MVSKTLVHKCMRTHMHKNKNNTCRPKHQCTYTYLKHQHTYENICVYKYTNMYTYIHIKLYTHARTFDNENKYKIS